MKNHPEKRNIFDQNVVIQEHNSAMRAQRYFESVFLNFPYKLFQKLRKKYKNKITKLMQKNPSLYDATQEGESEPWQSSVQRYKKEPIIGQASQKAGNSMELFCVQFFENYWSKQSQKMTIHEISEHYNVKSRRVYDLFGILDGLSFIEKMKRKGCYMWLGIQNNECRYKFQENQPVAQKDIAGLLKLLLFNCKSGLKVKELNEKIIAKIQEQTKKTQNTKTITRRIYECLKIMKIFGMIEKEGNLFRYAFGKINVKDLLKQNKEYMEKITERTQQKLLKNQVTQIDSTGLRNLDNAKSLSDHFQSSSVSKRSEQQTVVTSFQIQKQQ